MDQEQLLHATKRQGGTEVEEDHRKDDEKHRGDVAGNTSTVHDPFYVCKMR